MVAEGHHPRGGDTRPEVGEIIEQGVRRLATGIAESYGATAEVKFEPPRARETVNDEDATTFAVAAAEAVAGIGKVKHMAMPTMGGEDFAYMLEKKQGAYLMLGGGRGKDDAMVHHPKLSTSTMPFCRSDRPGIRRSLNATSRARTDRRPRLAGGGVRADQACRRAMSWMPGLRFGKNQGA